MKRRVYIETTIVSYLTARPSRNLIRTVHEALTREWWRGHRHLYDLYTSHIVLEEAGKGDADAARRRLLAVRDVPLVAPVESAIVLARQILDSGILHRRAATDALHLAIATVHRMDVLLTWNCRHLANASILVDVGRFLRIKGYEAPVVCTPNEMMGDPGELRG